MSFIGRYVTPAARSCILPRMKCTERSSYNRNAPPSGTTMWRGSMNRNFRLIPVAGWSGLCRSANLWLICYQCYHPVVATLLIRRMDEATKARLKSRASRHGRSLEAEAREILRAALACPPSQPKNLAEAMHSYFAPLGGVELPEIPREPMREPPQFEA